MPDIPDVVLKALYAGHKYLLCLKSSTNSLSSGEKEPPGSTDLLVQHYHDWSKYTREAIELLEKDG